MSEADPGAGAGAGRTTDAHSDLYVVGQEVPPPSDVNDTLVVGALVVAGVCAIVFPVALFLGLPLVVYGGGLAVGLLALAVAVRRYFIAAYPEINAVQPRESAAASEDLRASTPVSDVRRVARRSLLGRALVGVAGLFGLSTLSFVASLGPKPSDELARTSWRPGARLVTGEGSPLRPADVGIGGVATVWPEGAVLVEDSAVLLVRLSNRRPRPPTNLDWVVDETLVAYSKICTHAGCPVGLFREQDSVLFCPCHQSTFDAARGAIPTFGPTARALPQLPMDVDDAGFLVALGDFTEQVGPAYG
ncbi:MAG: ubiquinol-cytochrome c reductase iron-sulfur subunit [Actinobacteria bacterium]|nr:ubiquinol-cytochrome c reductase iron-sulfur subunit [Actinomycetota bacterium]